MNNVSIKNSLKFSLLQPGIDLTLFKGFKFNNYSGKTFYMFPTLKMLYKSEYTDIEHIKSFIYIGCVNEDEHYFGEIFNRKIVSLTYGKNLKEFKHNEFDYIKVSNFKYSKYEIMPVRENRLISRNAYFWESLFSGEDKYELNNYLIRRLSSNNNE